MIRSWMSCPIPGPFLFLAALALVGPVWAVEAPVQDGPRSVAILTDLSGSFEVQRKDQKIVAYAGMELFEGDSLKSPADLTATLVYENGQMETMSLAAGKPQAVARTPSGSRGKGILNSLKEGLGRIFRSQDDVIKEETGAVQAGVVLTRLDASVVKDRREKGELSVPVPSPGAPAPAEGGQVKSNDLTTELDRAPEEKLDATASTDEGLLQNLGTGKADAITGSETNLEPQDSGTTTGDSSAPPTGGPGTGSGAGAGALPEPPRAQPPAPSQDGSSVGPKKGNRALVSKPGQVPGRSAPFGPPVEPPAPLLPEEQLLQFKVTDFGGTALASVGQEPVKLEFKAALNCAPAQAQPVASALPLSNENDYCIYMHHKGAVEPFAWYRLDPIPHERIEQIRQAMASLDKGEASGWLVAARVLEGEGAIFHAQRCYAQALARLERNGLSGSALTYLRKQLQTLYLKTGEITKARELDWKIKAAQAAR